MIQKKSNRIIIISNNPVFISQIKLFEKEFDYFFAYLTSIPETLSEFLIIDAVFLGEFLNSKPNLTDTKFIVHGHQNNLKNSFNSGCVDFLRDPWDYDELEARIEKNFKSVKTDFRWNKVVISRYSLSIEGVSLGLSIEEYTILEKLIKNRGEAVPREALMFALWGKYKKNSRIVDMHISNLRKKLNILKIKQKNCCGDIKTIRSYGYLIDSISSYKNKIISFR